jgi:pimeloyl-ACP methyl ester carboxylesterase
MLRMRWLRALAGLAVFFSGCLPVGAGPWVEAAVSRYTLDVSAPHGQRISLYAEERGQGPPVVLLHGLGGSTYSWRFIAPSLAHRHRVIAIDLKGFGRSGKAFDTAYSATDQAHLIAEFITVRNLTGVTLIGHSFGGQVAMLTTLQLNRRTPSRIRDLVLIDAPALPQRLSPIVSLMQRPVLPYALLTALPPELVTSLALTPSPDHRYARAYTDADVEAYARPFHDAAARHAYVQTARQIAPGNLSDIVRAYRQIHQRTLLVWCTSDDIVPLATGQRLERMLPRARLERLEGCNHSPPDEAPIALTHALRRFLHR